MKKLLLLLCLTLVPSLSHAYTINFTDCTVDNRTFIWDQDVSQGVCIDLSTIYDILDPIAADTTDATAYLVFVNTSSAVSQTPKISTSLTYDATTGYLTATGYEAATTTSPSWTFKDSDSGNASKEVAKIYANYIDGTTLPNANIYIQAMVAGVETTYIETDVANSAIKLNKSVTVTGTTTSTTGFDSSAVSTPAYTFKDSESTNSGNETAKFYANAGAATTSGDFYLQGMIDGVETTYAQSDYANSQFKILKKTNITGGVVETISDKTSSYPIVSTDMGGIITNTGATGTITLTLPEASTVLGQAIMVVVVAAYTVYVDPADATDQIIGATNAAGDRISNATAGSTVTLRAIAANYWVVEGYYGTWADAS